ncbi:MAG TPA: adenylate/guanylate cyclase domain-containing protein [Burkholderiaceae bacterium]|nr:adenylate/guanylate cyclase domain-containing protein [Burkholderiaceae bacterium]
MLSIHRLTLRFAFAIVPVVVVILHVVGAVRLDLFDWIDNLIYDTRLRVTMPQTLDDRIVIVDIDEKSLAEVGRWPWSRNKMAALTNELFERQHAGAVGFDVVFAEPDESSGLRILQGLAGKELAHLPEFEQAVAGLAPSLDFDRQFARALDKRSVVLGHYFTADREGRMIGKLPEPVMTKADLKGVAARFVTWDGYGANLPVLMAAAGTSGSVNAITDADGVVRSVPLVSAYQDKYYASFSLAVYRALLGNTQVEPGFPSSRFLPKGYQGLESIVIRQGDVSVALPVDARAASLVPFRGPGGVRGGSFRYVSASDVLNGRLPADSLNGKVVLVGTTAPGLMDLRTTPVGAAYPGVEVHANLISGFLDGNVLSRPDYAMGYELTVALVSGLLLAALLPWLPAAMAIAFSAGLMLAVVALNFWLYVGHGLVFPLASALVMIASAFVLNMAYGYFAESRSKRELANLFGSYVPPELVDEMVKAPESYSMQAEARELTVLFCDMKGFTHLSETLSPEQLQHMLNRVFSRLTEVIRAHRGTIDKYMGDCVMAFWGAPVRSQDHALQAVVAAREMLQVLEQINTENAAQGLPAIGLGIGINTGPMYVGDMGSDIRRSYTVIGDAVNLASRLEALTRVYGVDIVVGELTRKQAHGLAWQEVDKVAVKGKDEAVTIFTPAGRADAAGQAAVQEELSVWSRVLKAYKAQDWDTCELHLMNLKRLYPHNGLYDHYASRLTQLRQQHLPADWDGVMRFTSK